MAGRMLPASPPAGKCDPQAEAFKQQFKKKKDQLVAKLFHLYNEKVFDNRLPPDMSITWNARLRRSGARCRNCLSPSPTNTELITCIIELSPKVCTTPDRVRDLLVHELCHAAVWLLDKEQDGHGPLWEAWTMKVRERLPELPPIEKYHHYEVEKKFIYRCIQCGYSVGRDSKSLNLEVMRCGLCMGNLELLVRTRSNGLRPPRDPWGFALFVKENYRSLKCSHPHMKHKEIMKLLGQMSSQVKMSTGNKGIKRKAPNVRRRYSSSTVKQCPPS